MNQFDGNNPNAARRLQGGRPPVSQDARAPSREGLWRKMFYGAAGVFVLGCAAVGTLYVQGVVTVNAPPDGSARAAETTDKQPQNVFARHIRQAGMSKCTTVFPLLGEMLVAGAQYTARSHWNSENADQHMLQALVGLDYKSDGYEARAGGFVFASPLPGGGCEGAMVRIAPFPKACTDVEALLPEGSTAADTLSGIQTYQLGSGQGHAMLLPAGTASCVAISSTAIAQ